MHVGVLGVRGTSLKKASRLLTIVWVSLKSTEQEQKDCTWAFLAGLCEQQIKQAENIMFLFLNWISCSVWCRTMCEQKGVPFYTRGGMMGNQCESPVPLAASVGTRTDTAVQIPPLCMLGRACKAWSAAGLLITLPWLAAREVIKAHSAGRALGAVQTAPMRTVHVGLMPCATKYLRALSQFLTFLSIT